MDQINKFHQKGQKFTLPRVFLAILLFFVGLNCVAKLYAQLPVWLQNNLPAGLNPKLVEEFIHLLTAISLALAGFLAKKTLDVVFMRRKYPRYYLYCHQNLEDDGKHSLVFGHFTISCSKELEFGVEGDSYRWTGKVLQRSSHWSSKAIASNTNQNAREVFILFNTHPTATAAPSTTWIAAFKESDAQGAIGDGLAYEALIQEISWKPNSRQYFGYAELVESPPWWRFRGTPLQSATSLKTKLEESMHKLERCFNDLFPSVEGLEAHP